jgi:hypothetical protein
LWGLGALSSWDIPDTVGFIHTLRWTVKRPQPF